MSTLKSLGLQTEEHVEMTTETQIDYTKKYHVIRAKFIGVFESLNEYFVSLYGKEHTSKDLAEVLHTFVAETGANINEGWDYFLHTDPKAAKEFLESLVDTMNEPITKTPSILVIEVLDDSFNHIAFYATTLGFASFEGEESAPAFYVKTIDNTLEDRIPKALSDKIRNSKFGQVTKTSNPKASVSVFMTLMSSIIDGFGESPMKTIGVSEIPVEDTQRPVKPLGELEKVTGFAIYAMPLDMPRDAYGDTSPEAKFEFATGTYTYSDNEDKEQLVTETSSVIVFPNRPSDIAEFPRVADVAAFTGNPERREIVLQDVLGNFGPKTTKILRALRKDLGQYYGEAYSLRESSFARHKLRFVAETTNFYVFQNGVLAVPQVFSSTFSLWIVPWKNRAKKQLDEERAFRLTFRDDYSVIFFANELRGKRLNEAELMSAEEFLAYSGQSKEAAEKQEDESWKGISKKFFNNATQIEFNSQPPKNRQTPVFWIDYTYLDGSTAKQLVNDSTDINTHDVLPIMAYRFFPSVTKTEGTTTTNDWARAIVCLDDLALFNGEEGEPSGNIYLYLRVPHVADVKGEDSDDFLGQMLGKGQGVEFKPYTFNGTSEGAKALASLASQAQGAGMPESEKQENAQTEESEQAALSTGAQASTAPQKESKSIFREADETATSETDTSSQVSEADWKKAEDTLMNDIEELFAKSFPDGPPKIPKQQSSGNPKFLLGWVKVWDAYKQAAVKQNLVQGEGTEKNNQNKNVLIDEALKYIDFQKLATMKKTSGKNVSQPFDLQQYGKDFRKAYKDIFVSLDRAGMKDGRLQKASKWLRDSKTGDRLFNSAAHDAVSNENSPKTVLLLFLKVYAQALLVTIPTIKDAKTLAKVLQSSMLLGWDTGAQAPPK
jgi:hypothetical protein